MLVFSGYDYCIMLPAIILSIICVALLCSIFGIWGVPMFIGIIAVFRY